jgi:SAM-dependent methyltransferase
MTKQPIQNWQESEREKYNHLYEDLEYFPQNVGIGYNNLCKNLTESINGPISILDIGCGPGFSLEIAGKYGIDAVGIDIAPCLSKVWRELGVNAVVACSDALPFDDYSFDVITAWDVMEHIPEEGVLDTLMEMKRVAKNKTLISLIICLEEERHKFGVQCHVTLKPPIWWERKFRDSQMMIMQNNYDKGKTHIVTSLRVIK